MIRRPARIVATVAVLSLLWGCASPQVELADAHELYENADYYQAYVAILKARDANPDDPEIEATYWKIRQAYLLAEAQRLVFSNQEQAALENLEMVLALDPENRIALRWRQKAFKKMADRAASEGDRLLAGGDLEGALQAFDSSLRYDPENVLAREGLDKLGKSWRRTQQLARGHFLSGVRALGDHQYRRTRYHLGIAIEKDPTLTEARSPAEVAERQIAEERLATARAMEDEGFFAAALSEYEQVAERHPDLDGIQERLERAEAEDEAARLAEEGEMLVYKGEYARARELLEEAFAKTTRQKDAIGEKLLMTRERELEARYVDAKDLELQRLLDQALAAYRKIDDDMAGFRDVRARIADLELRIDEATKAYELGTKAQESGDIDAAIEAFTDVQLFWQGYSDSRELLDALRKQRDAQSADGG